MLRWDLSTLATTPCPSHQSFQYRYRHPMPYKWCFVFMLQIYHRAVAATDSTKQIARSCMGVPCISIMESQFLHLSACFQQRLSNFAGLFIKYTNANFQRGRLGVPGWVASHVTVCLKRIREIVVSKPKIRNTSSLTTRSTRVRMHAPPGPCRGQFPSLQHCKKCGNVNTITTARL